MATFVEVFWTSHLQLGDSMQMQNGHKQHHTRVHHSHDSNTLPN